MEIKDAFAIVLTRDGQFCRVPSTPGMSIGVEVSFVDTSMVNTFVGIPARGSRNRYVGRSWYKWGAASAAACLAISVALWQGFTTAQAYTYVSLDINPSLSLGLDKNDNVVDVLPANTDGQRLAAALNIKGQSLKQAIHTIVDSAVKENMLPPKDSIIVTAAPAKDSTDVTKVQQEATADVQSALAENPQAHTLGESVYTVRVSKAVFQAAKKAKVSPGKLAAYLVAKKKGILIKRPDLEGQSLQQVLGNNATGQQNVVDVDNSAQISQAVVAMQSAADDHSPSVLVTTAPQTNPQPDQGPKGKAKGHDKHAKDDKSSAVVDKQGIPIVSSVAPSVTVTVPDTVATAPDVGLANQNTSTGASGEKKPGHGKNGVGPGKHGVIGKVKELLGLGSGDSGQQSDGNGAQGSSDNSGDTSSASQSEGSSTPNPSSEHPLTKKQDKAMPPQNGGDANNRNGGNPSPGQSGNHGHGHDHGHGKGHAQGDGGQSQGNDAQSQGNNGQSQGTDGQSQVNGGQSPSAGEQNNNPGKGHDKGNHEKKHEMKGEFGSPSQSLSASSWTNGSLASSPTNTTSSVSNVTSSSTANSTSGMASGSIDNAQNSGATVNLTSPLGSASVQVGEPNVQGNGMSQTSGDGGDAWNQSQSTGKKSHRQSKDSPHGHGDDHHHRREDNSTLRNSGNSLLT